jgi:hypothetical protein
VATAAGQQLLESPHAWIAKLKQMAASFLAVAVRGFRNRNTRTSICWQVPFPARLWCATRLRTIMLRACSNTKMEQAGFQRTV